MAAIDYPPFDGDGVSTDPHRPSLDQLGGNGKVDDQNYPPSSDEPSGDEHNRFAELLALIGASMPVLIVTIDFASGTPFLARFWCANTTVASGDITVADNGAGDTTLTYPASKLPASIADPVGTVNASTSSDIRVTLDEVTRQIRVRTSGGDLRCTVVVR